MYLARFSYQILPVNRHQALELINREVKAAQSKGLNARLLVPLTRGHGGAALQFEVELEKLDEHSVTAKRGNATCLATRVAGAGREICLSVHSRQSQNADVSGLLYCYENGFHLLHCYDGRGKAGAMMPTWARAYGMDPDEETSPR